MVLSRWQANTALFTGFGLVSATLFPVLATTRADAFEIPIQPPLLAQLFAQSPSIVIPAGTMIPVTYDEGEKIVITPEESTDVSLTVAEDIYSRAGTLIIPEGSHIEGELRPVDGGTQFISDQVVFSNGLERDIDARSVVLTDTETITKDTDPDILRGAVIGAAAAAVLSEILGDIDFIEVLGGAGLGALASILIGGNREEVEVFVIEPETDLDLRLQSDFVY
jgi:hypothetical protein